MSDRFDFGDGNGPVPAAQHPIGGGWVAATAHVDPEAHVDSTARVFGKAVVGPHAAIFGESRVFGKATVADEARIWDAIVSGHAYVGGNADVNADQYRGQACPRPTISDHAVVVGCVTVSDSATILGRARVVGSATVCGSAIVQGDAIISGSAIVSRNATVGGDAFVGDKSCVTGDATVDGGTIAGWSQVEGDTYVGPGAVLFDVTLRGGRHVRNKRHQILGARLEDLIPRPVDGVIEFTPEVVKEVRRLYALQDFLMSGSTPSPSRKARPKPMELAGTLADFVASESFWVAAAEIDAFVAKPRSVGRPVETCAADILLVEIANRWSPSVRLAIELVAKPEVWEMLQDRTNATFPNDRLRRLSKTPPTRSQRARFRTRYERASAESEMTCTLDEYVDAVIDVWA